jgi:tungstate transport system ATP-binding protein
VDSGPAAEREPRELLAAGELDVRYQGRRVLDVERLTLREGELLAVLGPNGSGKSTLMRVLSMLETPTAGWVRYREQTGDAAEWALRRNAAVVFQRSHLWAGSVGYNVGLGLRLRRSGREEIAARVRRACAALGVEDLIGRDVGELSGGEAQRVALARALVLEPEILFLDEPTANLDAEVRGALLEDLARLTQATARGTLLITHDRAEAFYLADRVAVLKDGRLIQTGTPSDLYENPADPYIAEVTGAELTLRGRVVGREDDLLVIESGGVRLLSLGTAPVGANVRLAYRPEDLILADAPRESSARNRFEATVTEVRPVGGLFRVRLDGPPEVIAVITRSSADGLGVTPGARLIVHVKATALRAFPG